MVSAAPEHDLTSAGEKYRCRDGTCDLRDFQAEAVIPFNTDNQHEAAAVQNGFPFS